MTPPDASPPQQSSGGGYQPVDAPHYDYDLRPIAGLPERWRGAPDPLPERYGVCIGAAQTMGRFTHRPYPTVLQERLGLPVLNLGRGGAGPRFFGKAFDPILANAEFVVVQFMAGRSAGTEGFDDCGGQDRGVRIRDGKPMRFEDYLAAVFEEEGPEAAHRLVEIARDRYVTQMQALLARCGGYRVLLWISKREPHERDSLEKPGHLLNSFPQMLNRRVYEACRDSADACVKLVSEQGIPQRLWQADQPIGGARLIDGTLFNYYYPSPENHEEAGRHLAEVLAQVIERPQPPATSPDPIEQPATLACFLHWTHPVPGRAHAPESARRIAASQGLQARFLHVQVPERTTDSDRHELSKRQGLYVITSPPLLEEDIRYFERSAPDRLQRVFDELRKSVGLTTEELRVHPTFVQAVAAAREAQAARASMVLSMHAGELIAQAWIVSRLLDVPLWIDLPTQRPADEWIQLTALALRDARQVTIPKTDVAPWWEDLQSDVHPIERGIATQTPLGIAPRSMPKVWAQAGSAGDPTPWVERRLLVLGAERTGTNMVVSQMNSSKNAVIGGELFNPRLIDDGVLPWPGDREGATEELLQLRRDDPAALIDELFRAPGGGEAQVRGFKLLYFHGAADQRVLDRLLADDALRVLHIRRRNRLRRYASLEVAKMRDSWASVGGKPEPRPRVSISVRAMLRDFHRAEAFERRFACIFSGHRVLEVFYEDFSTNTAELKADLEVLLDTSFGQFESRYVKTGSSDLRDIISNWDEVEGTLRGTRWETFLDD